MYKIVDEYIANLEINNCKYTNFSFIIGQIAPTHYNSDENISNLEQLFNSVPFRDKSHNVLKVMYHILYNYKIEKISITDGRVPFFCINNKWFYLNTI